MLHGLTLSLPTTTATIQAPKMVCNALLQWCFLCTFHKKSQMLQALMNQNVHKFSTHI
jgi:hypothetical protein